MEDMYLLKRSWGIAAHSDLEAMKVMEKADKPDKIVTKDAWIAAGSRAYIDENGEIQLGIPAAEKARQEEIENLTAEEKSLMKELADNDWQVTRSAEQGQVLATTVPDLHERRQYCRTRISAIRDRLKELEAA